MKGRHQHLCALVAAALLLWPLSASAQNDGTIRLSPTVDADSYSGFLIPGDINEAIAELHRMLPAEFVKTMREGTEDDMIIHHFGLGMWLRNNWGLWRGSILQTYFAGLGLDHPDDMSGVILDSFWRSLNGKPLDLEAQVEHYVTYWKHWSYPESLVCPTHGAEVDIYTSAELSEATEDLRVLHLGKCEKEGEYWVYEAERGLFEPDDETLQFFKE